MVFKKLEEKPLSLDMITAGEETQMRYATRSETVTEYVEILKSSESAIAWPFNDKLIIFKDGPNYWLADGFHRYKACREAGRSSAHCIVYEGTLEDAQDYALQANTSHGLRRTNEDKRKAVERALSMDRWASRSDRVIAEHVGVSQPFVGKVRKELNNSTDNGYQLNSQTPEKPTLREGKDGKKRKVEKSTEKLPQAETPPEEDYEDTEPPEAVEPQIYLGPELEPIRDKLLEHFSADELPTSPSHYKAISRLGVDGAVDVVELARETAEEPKLQDYRNAAKALDSKYAKSILVQHLESAMRACDDLNRHVKNPEAHAKVLQGIQMAWEDVKGWK